MASYIFCKDVPSFIAPGSHKSKEKKERNRLCSRWNFWMYCQKAIVSTCPLNIHIHISQSAKIVSCISRNTSFERWTYRQHQVDTLARILAEDREKNASENETGWNFADCLSIGGAWVSSRALTGHGSMWPFYLLVWASSTNYFT